MFADPLREWVDLVLPATSYLERDGTMVNLEGRAQRLRRTVIPPAPDEVAWLSKLAERFGVAIDPHARHDADGQMPERAEAGRGASSRRRRRPRLPTAARSSSSATARSSRAPWSSASRSSSSNGPTPRSSSRSTTPRSATSRRGEHVVVRSNGTSVRLRARVNRHLVQGAVRAPEEHVRELDQAVEVSKQ